jgi:hypothetical protein
VAQDDGYPPKLTFDAREATAVDTVRQVFWNRLRVDRSYCRIQGQDGVFSHYVEYAQPRDEADFQRLVIDVFWELVTQGVLSPGSTTGNPSPPFFHLTEYGKKVVQDPSFQPHDPSAFMAELGQVVPSPDPTVMAYLSESLHCFARTTHVASAMMLGIASERVFMMVCESLASSLADVNERATFQGILDRNPIKPKLDWVTQKLQQIQTPRRPAGWPEDVDIKLPGIYNLIRCQRNELGHPRPTPPTITRDDAYGYLRIFPSYYATAEQVREFLARNRV